MGFENTWLLISSWKNMNIVRAKSQQPALYNVIAVVLGKDYDAKMFTVVLILLEWYAFKLINFILWMRRERQICLFLHSWIYYYLIYAVQSQLPSVKSVVEKKKKVCNEQILFKFYSMWLLHIGIVFMLERKKMTV